MSEIDELARAAAVDDLTALPWLVSAIGSDRGSGMFARWGLSTVVDENVGAPVISRALFDQLHARAGIDAAWPIGNAGLLHCYGYLLSVTPTPFGLKRDRWIEPGLAHACGLPGDAFIPWRGPTTLLARATAAADGIRRDAGIRHSAIVGGRRTELALHVGDPVSALAYAVAPDASSEPLLVTMFPVADATAIDAEFRGDVRLRWNAV